MCLIFSSVKKFIWAEITDIHSDMSCDGPLWHLYCTFITRDEWLCPALKVGGNDGAVSMWKNVL